MVKLIIVMVGLPARGKSYISQKLTDTVVGKESYKIFNK